MDSEESIGLERTVGASRASGAGEPTLRDGEIFGPFRVLSKVGRGAMGEVYQVKRLADGNVFALKVIAAELMRDGLAVARFRQEARTLCALHNANIVAAFQMGEEDGRHWLTMQLCDGLKVAAADGQLRQARSLDEYADARGGRLTQAELLAVVDDVLAGLAYAHDQGMVHRDLKPANILLFRGANRRPFRALISDFGLVRIVGEERIREQVERSIGLSLTRAAAGDDAKAWLGNWAYMSPEQKRGQPAVKGSDLYAVGLLAYRLGTGKDLGLEAASELNPDLVPEWDEFIGQALEELPEKRYASAQEMRVALGRVREAWQRREAVRRNQEKAEKAQRRLFSRRKRIRLFLGATGLGAVVSAGYFFLWAPRVESARSPMLPPAITTPELSDNRPTNKTEETTVQAPATSALPPSALPPASLGAELTNRVEGPEQQMQGAAQAAPPAQKKVTTYDLAADWSDTVNPNGCWTYLLNGLPAKSGVRGMDPFASPGAPNIWGNNRRCDGWSKSRGTELAKLDIQAGDIYAHTSTKRGAVAFRWTSPSSGSAEISGGVWALRDIGRSTEWRICLNGAVLVSGISAGRAQTRSHPEKVQLKQFVKGGDAIEFFADQLTNSICDYIGVSLKISLTAEPEAEAKAVTPSAASAPSVRAATKETPWVNSLGMQFVPVPGTSTLFGVWLTRLQDFEAFVKATGYQATTNVYSTKGSDDLKKRGDTWMSPGFDQGPTCPVVGVNWYDAKAFCAWLTEKELAAGRIETGQEYRLPTDAEWSLAEGLTNETGSAAFEKGSNGGNYSWGSQWPPPPAAGNFAGEEVKPDWPSSWGLIEGYRDSYPRTSPVGSFAANQYGLFDMAGNVNQWCEDRGSGARGLWRGSSWYDFEKNRLQLGARNGLGKNIARTQAGFRVVLVMSASRPAATEQMTPEAAAGLSRTGQFSPSTEPWRDAMADPAVLVLEKNVDRVPGGLEFTCSPAKRMGASAYLCDAGNRNCAIRLLAVNNSDNGIQIIREANTNPGSNFALKLAGNKHVTLASYVYQTRKNMILGDYTPETFPKQGETYELELRLAGKELTCKLDGKMLGTVEVPQITEGRFLVGQFNNGTNLLCALQYLPLPD
jgi:serine/threonine protein kinase